MEKCEITGFGTHIKVADIEKSREFYESLGFKPVFAYGDEKWRANFPDIPSAAESYRGLTFAIGENAKLEIAEGHIGIKHQDVFKTRIENEKVSAMVNVKSLVPLFTPPSGKIDVRFPVRHYYWGTIEAAFRDPDGFVLVFIAPYSEEEFNSLSQLTKIEKIEKKN
jgi:catechol 2,3-dioxygenase-like lactoylglutathione lyase family enzyme